MKFMLTRTSNWDKKPHPKAIMMEFDSYTNPQWGIEINTLEELIEFLKDENVKGQIVIEESFDEEHPEDRMIEIYDDYRE